MREPEGPGSEPGLAYEECPELGIIVYRRSPGPGPAMDPGDRTAGEIVICLDSPSAESPEDTADPTHPNLFVLRCHGLGWARATDRALRLSRGELLALLGDGPISPGSLEDAKRLFAAHPRLSLLGVPSRYEPPGAPPPPLTMHRLTGKPFGHVEALRGGPVILKRGAFERVGGWDLLLAESGDPGPGLIQDLCRRLWLGGFEVAVSGGPENAVAPDEVDPLIQRYLNAKFERDRLGLHQQMARAQRLFEHRLRRRQLQPVEGPVDEWEEEDADETTATVAPASPAPVRVVDGASERDPFQPDEDPAPESIAEPVDDGTAGRLPQSGHLTLVVSNPFEEERRPLPSGDPTDRRPADRRRGPPPTPARLLSWGLSAQRQGDLQTAQWLYEEALEIDPGNAEVHNNLGLVQKSLSNYNRAIHHLQAAILATPANTTFWANLGNLLRQMRLPELAVLAYRRSLRSMPTNVTALTNLSEVLRQSSKVDEARKVLEEGQWRLPDSPEILHHLGMHEMLTGNVPEAEELLRQALDIGPRYGGAAHTLGILLQRQNRIPEAIEMLQRALTRQGDLTATRTHLAQCLLLSGKLDEGFRELTARERAPSRTGAEPPPAWTGDFLGGRTVLLHWQGDVNDFLFFSRFLPGLRARGGALRVVAPQDVLTLLPGLAPAEGIPEGQAVPVCDTACSFVRLPSIVGHRAGVSIEPYLSSPAGEPAPLPPPTPGRKRIGVCWTPPRCEPYEIVGTLTLEEVLRTLPSEGTDVFLLQARDQTIPLTGSISHVTDVRSSLKNFRSLAAALEAVDLVVTTPGAAAHLAGGMGRPLEIIVPTVPDWHWGLEGTETPWYPTARVVRPGPPGEGERRLAQLADDLRRWLELPAAP